MPVGVSKWRAGIVHINPGFQLVTLPRVLLLDLLQSKCLTLHSLNGAVVLFPVSMILYFPSVAISAIHKWLELRAISSKVFAKSFAAFHFFSMSYLVQINFYFVIPPIFESNYPGKLNFFFMILNVWIFRYIFILNYQLYSLVILNKTQAQTEMAF